MIICDSCLVVRSLTFSVTASLYGIRAGLLRYSLSCCFQALHGSAIITHLFRPFLYIRLALVCLKSPHSDYVRWLGKLLVCGSQSMEAFAILSLFCQNPIKNIFILSALPLLPMFDFVQFFPVN